ncbi:hypothetical protein [Nesterenkonia sp.]|uniref:hypothetical protein n=1 Tax=Nesterenkonia sp. TaxID=704201 RepID=UPI0026030726|nr:hypothetical protein [Nesterenkonia sp.]
MAQPTTIQSPAPHRALRPSARQTLAALGLTAALLAAPAAAASASALQGQTVEPGSNQDEAPTLQPGASYTGTFGEETAYYRVARTMEGSTLHIGISSFDQSGEHYDDATLRLSTLSGESCDDDTVDWHTSTAANLVRTAQVRATAPHDPEHWQAVEACGSAEELLLAVEANGEELIGQDYELVVGEEPEPLNVDELRQDLDPDRWEDGLQWQPLERDRDSENTIEPGSSLHNAPLLEKGTTYDTSIEPGQVHIYRIEAGWNEQIQAQAFFPEPSSELSESLGSWTDAHVGIISPYRGSATPDSSAAPSEQNLSSRIDDTRATTLTAQTYPVTWSGRYMDRPHAEARNASTSGEHFIMVAAEPLEDDEEGFAIPYRLTADTFTTAETPEPMYEQDILQPPSGDSGSAEAGSVDAEQTGGISTAAGIALSLGAFGLLLIAAGGLFLVRVMRRTD